MHLIQQIIINLVGINSSIKKEQNRIKMITGNFWECSVNTQFVIRWAKN